MPCLKVSPSCGVQDRAERVDEERLQDRPPEEGLRHALPDLLTHIPSQQTFAELQAGRCGAVRQPHYLEKSDEAWRSSLSREGGAWVPQRLLRKERREG